MKGLYSKYTLINNDTSKPVTGKYFILKPENDIAAVKALLTYAENTDNKLLSNDILDWLKNLNIEQDNKPKNCNHENLEYYNHGYHAICKDCGEQVY